MLARIAFGATLLLACTTGPGADDPYCSPDVSTFEAVDPYVEPATPSVPPERQNAPGATYEFRWIFPPAANSGRSITTYWLTGDENLDVQLEANLGDGAPSATQHRLTVVCFIDGVQQTIRTEAAPARVDTFELSPTMRTVTRRYALEGTAIPRGAHTVTFFIWRADHEFQLGYSLVVFKDSTRFVNLEPTTGTTGPRGEEQFGAFAFNSDTGSQITGESSAPPGGTLPVTIRLQTNNSVFESCARTDQSYLIVALLDGEQIPIGALGLRPHFVLRHDQRAMAATTLQNLPQDGQLHRLQLIRIPGYGRYLEDGTLRTVWFGFADGVTLTWR